MKHYSAERKEAVLRKMRSVATKYLPHYLAWMRLLTWRGTGVSADELLASALGRQAINL